MLYRHFFCRNTRRSRSTKEDTEISIDSKTTVWCGILDIYIIGNIKGVMYSRNVVELNKF